MIFYFRTYMFIKSILLYILNLIMHQNKHMWQNFRSYRDLAEILIAVTLRASEFDERV